MNSPININQSVLQSFISERVQQVQQNPDTQQRYFENQFSKETIKNQHRVKEFEETDYIQIRNKEGRKQHKRPQKGRKDKKQMDTEPFVNAECPAKIDITA